MKKITIIFFVLTAFVFSNCNSCSNSTDAAIIETESSASNPNNLGKGPVMKFDSETFDFGTINEGEQVEHIFEFKNVGDKPLLISEVQVTCGCTVPKWPREPIKPGQTSEIKIQFNSTGKKDLQKKDVTIIANTTPIETVISFTALVIAKPEE
ncbi:MAG: DUF1573 domain-containing protein [Flavobacteriales bacterium]|nr:DUF1573 domain-containing protein [Flavobacteriales bacterium]